MQFDAWFVPENMLLRRASIGYVVNSLGLWFNSVAVTLLLHLGIMAAYLGAFEGDVSALVCVDREKIGRWPFEAISVGFTGSYDGQFYYVLARNPWQRTEAFIDLPSLRHSRILFPALAWLASGGGNPQRLLWILPVLNMTCIAGLAWLGSVWAITYGRTPMWGCLLPIVVNAGTPALCDLTDPLATFSVAALLVAWLRRCSPWMVWALAMAAVLSRETNAAVVGIVLADALFQRRWRVGACLVAVLATWLAFVVALHNVYGVWPFYSNNICAPFEGISYRLARIYGDGGSQALPIHAIGVGVLLLQIGLSVAMVFFRPHRTLFLVALAGAVLAAMGGTTLFGTGHCYLRVFNWMPLGIWLWSVQSGRNWPVWLLSPGLLCPCFAVVQVWRA